MLLTKWPYSPQSHEAPMTPVPISPKDALARMQAGAVLVDIRETSERRRLHIAGSRHHPLSSTPAQGTEQADMIFHCASGACTQTNAHRLAAQTTGQSYLLDGGISAWKQAGLPVVEDRTQPIDIMRQVMIVAGSLVLMGVLLGAFVNPLFFGLSGFVGAGLLFSGVTGFCAMARMLALAPWNRIQTTQI
jgi:rhodanese-related sulfurtransferase